MGRELLCTVRSGGKTAKGRALLEASEILFRGDLRLKIPFAALKSVAARDGEVHVKWADGSAVFELGEQAEKWAHKILHPRSRAEKLGIKLGLTVSAVGVRDAEFANELRRHAKIFSGNSVTKNFDLIFFGAEATVELKNIRKLAGCLASTGALWIVYPKGRKEISQQQVFAAGKAAGLVDVKVVSFSATHTALKFVVPKANRSRE